MPGVPRVPDPTTEFDIDTAVSRLFDALRKADPDIRVDEPPFVAAAHHLSRCGAVECNSTYPDGLSVPIVHAPSGEERRACCGEAKAIRVLLLVSWNRSELKELHRAVVRQRRPFEGIATELEPPLLALLEAIDAQNASVAARDPEPTASARTAALTRPPAARVARSSLVDALGSLEQPTGDDLPNDGLRRDVASLRDGLYLVGVLLDRLEGRLADRLAYAELHAPVEGAGRPSLALLAAIARLLSETGHAPSQIAELVPSGGSTGAAERIRQVLRPTRSRRKT